MLVLEEVGVSSEDVLNVQPQVAAYWDKDCLGQGTLYLTLQFVFKKFIFFKILNTMFRNLY